MDKIEVQARLLSAESKPYNVDGNEGISHRIRLLVGSDVFSAKSSADQVKTLKDFEGKDGTAVLAITSRKESLSLSLVSFE